MYGRRTQLEEMGVTSNYPRSSSTLRRLRYGSWTLILIGASIAAAIFANIIAAHARVTIDFSAGTQTLTARTLSILDSTAEPISIILSADLDAADPAARVAAIDTLALLGESNAITATTINLASPTASSEIDAYTLSVLAFEQQQAETQRELIANTLKRTTSLTAQLNQTADALDTLTAALDQQDRAQLFQQSSLLRVHTESVSAARDAIASASQASSVYPPAAQVAGILDTPERLISTAAQYALAIQRFAQQSAARANALNNFERAELARALSSTALQAAETASALEADRIALRPLTSELIDNTLRQSPALLITAAPVSEQPRTVPINPGPLLAQSGVVAGQRSADIQWVLATGIASAADDKPPLLVYTHAEPTKLFEQPTRTRRASDLRNFVARLRSERIEVIEWAVALDPRPPATGNARAADRPVIYWISAGFGDPSQTERGRNREALSGALETLLKNNEPFVLNLGPSELPGLGLTDPIAEVLEAHSVSARTQELLVQSLPNGALSTAPSPRSTKTSNPLADAISNRPAVFPDAIQLDPPAAGSAWTPLFTPNSVVAPWQTITSWIQHPVLNKTDAVRTGFAPPASLKLEDTSGNTVPLRALLLTRTIEDRIRQTIIASDSWYVDSIALNQIETIDGRTTNTLQGNAELVTALVYYTANRDNRIIQGSETAGPPRVPDSFQGRGASVTRYVLTLGVPLIILFAGGLLRSRI